jgi:hypothetical protein
MTDDFPVAIIGAGPAGLALAAQLKHLRIRHVVLEQGVVADSWKRMSPALELVSPWWTNTLDWRGLCRHLPLARVRAPAYARYLEEFQALNSITVRTGCRVQAVRPTQRGAWRLETSLGQVSARLVVVATGYFAYPVGPRPDFPSDDSIPTLHAAELHDPHSIDPKGRPVLVVGRRITAGQLMVGLIEAGFRVSISCLAPIEFRRDGALGWLRDHLYFAWEELLIRLRPRLHAPSFPTMDGGRTRYLVEKGAVEIRPAITSVQCGSVYFADGTTMQPGLIILATGYRPTFPFLPQNLALEDDSLPRCDEWHAGDGLYFLGLDNRMNYRSRTLRGIRHDARVLAALLAARTNL